MPAGGARIAASSFRSASRLKAIAKLRAVTMHSRMPSRSCAPKAAEPPGHHRRQQREREREQRVAEANQFEEMAESFSALLISHAEAQRREE